LSEDLPEKIVTAVLENLRGRKGFDWVFDDISEQVNAEIEQDLISTVRDLMNY
jgi:hypothetical protein